MSCEVAFPLENRTSGSNTPSLQSSVDVVRVSEQHCALGVSQSDMQCLHVNMRLLLLLQHYSWESTALMANN